MVMPVALAELKETLLGNNWIVCNLSASGLTLDCVSILPAQLKPLKHVYALDLSLNRIRSSCCLLSIAFWTATLCNTWT